jgi:hypothetical protein
MFFGPGSPVLAMARTTAQRSGAVEGGAAAVGTQLRALGADNLTIGVEQLRAVPAGDGGALIVTLRKLAAGDRIAAMQRAGLLDAVSSGSLKLTPDQREQVSALIWQGAQPSELGAHVDVRRIGEAVAPTSPGDAPIIMPPILTPPLMGARPELVLALHDVLDAMRRHAVHEVLGRLARMDEADQRAIYADPRFRTQFNALSEGDERSAAGHFKESLRVAQTSGAHAALLGYPTDIDSEHKVHVEALGAQMNAAGPGGQADLRRAYVLVEQLGGPQRVRANPVLLVLLSKGDREAVQRLALGGDGAGLLGKRDRLDRDDDKETANQLIFGQPDLGAGSHGASDPATEAEFMYYRLRDAARIRSGVSIADWLSTDGARADEAVAEFMVLYQRVRGAGLSLGDLAQLADLYHRALRRLDSYQDTADSLASTAAQIVGATVATIVVTVASGGVLGPVAVGAMATVSAAASSAAAGAMLRVHNTMTSVLKDTGTGAIEGITAAAGASLTARIVRSAAVGLPAGRAAASVGAHAVGQAAHAGAEIAAAVIDGALGGASGELFQTATDEATWDRGIAEAFAAMLAAIARGALTGAAMGAGVGVATQAIAKLGRTIGKAGARGVPDEAGIAVARDHAPSTTHMHEGPRLETAAQRGVDPTPESIRLGTVRMEDHPDFRRVLAELKAKGYTFEYVNTEAPKVKLVETVTPEGEPIDTQKYVLGHRGMRWIDLEHELGHVDQIEAMAAKGKLLATDRQLENGRGYQGQNGKNFIDAKLNSVLEYHNRLIEYFRLKERGVDPMILRAHADGLDRWRKVYENKASRSPSMQAFIQENIPDLPELNMRWLKEKRGVP